MSRARTSQPVTPVDLRATRRTFLFAREQIAAHTGAHYLAARAMRSWDPNAGEAPMRQASPAATTLP
jgi:hypothetical protein